MSDKPEFLLAALSPTLQQRRVAIASAAVLLVAFGVAAPFAATPLPRFDAFIPTLEAAIFITDLITAVLLFGQYSIFPSRALLVLACGYLFRMIVQRHGGEIHASPGQSRGSIFRLALPVTPRTN